MTHSLALLTPDLTAPERQLVLAAVRGAVADLDGQPIRGAVLRDLLEAARPGWVVHPKGLRLQRARLTGGVDLEGCVLDRAMFLSRVVVETDDARGALLLEDASLRRLSLHDVRLEGALIADRATFEGGLYLSGCDALGQMQLHGAVVRGALGVENSRLGDGRLALDAAGLEVNGALVLRRTHLRGQSRLVGARIAGGLQAEASVFGVPGQADQNGDLTNRDRPVCVALDITGAAISGDVILADAKSGGAIVMARAAIGGCLDTSRVAIEGGGLNLARCSIAHSTTLQEARLEGVLDLAGARFGGGLVGRAIEVHGGRTALDAVRVVVAGDVDLERAKLVGVVDCRGGEVRGNLSLASARLYGALDALAANGLAVHGGITLDKAVVFGCIRLSAAVIGETLSACGTSVKVDRGAALIAHGLRVGCDALFDGGLRAVGAVVLTSARIGGTLSFADSNITAVRRAGGGPDKASRAKTGALLPVSMHASREADGDAIVLADAAISHLVMPRRAENRPRGVVDLSRAHAARFEDYAAAWPPPLCARSVGSEGRDIDHLVLTGFRYDRLVHPAGEDPDVAAAESGKPVSLGVAKRRIAWLEAQSGDDVASNASHDTWRFLASRLAAQGFEDDARRVHIARRRRQACRSGASWISRWRGRAFDLVALYGFGPWRTVAWLVATVLVFSALFGWAARQCPQPGCMDDSVFVASRRSDNAGGGLATSYPPFNPILFSLDTALPGIGFGASDYWGINTRWSMTAARERTDAVSSNRGASATAALTAKSERGSGFIEQGWTLTLGVLLEGARIFEMLLGALLSVIAVMGFAGFLRDDR